MDPNLLLVCLSSFIAVFVLLALLALVMRGLMAVFPERTPADDGTDPVVLAAVTTAASAAFPGMRVTSVEEDKR